MDGNRRNRGGRTMAECEIPESEPCSYKRRRLILWDFRPVDLYRTIDDPAVLLLPASVSGGLAFGPLFGSLYSFIGAAGGAFYHSLLHTGSADTFQHMPLKLDSLRTLLRKNGFSAFCS